MPAKVKLSSQQIKEIKNLKGTATQADIGKAYGISGATVSRIMRGAFQPAVKHGRIRRNRTINHCTNIPCPTCGVGVGERCKRANGMEATAPHSHRAVTNTKPKVRSQQHEGVRETARAIILRCLPYVMRGGDEYLAEDITNYLLPK